MREILFRGKCKRTGKWYEGYYYSLPAPLTCFSEGERKEDEHLIVFENPHCVPDWNMPREMVQASVLPETVGQYTGLTDKDGNKIFEGDILAWHSCEDNTDELSFVIFDEDRCGYVQAWEGSDFKEKIIAENLRVIGNIHDNPELLKGE